MPVQVIDKNGNSKGVGSLQFIGKNGMVKFSLDELGEMLKIVYDQANISQQLLGITATQTVTNKRITKRVTSIVTSATPTPNADTDDVYIVTALTTAAAFAAPTGIPTQGQSLILRIIDDGTSRALSFDPAYRFSPDLPAPNSTTVSKTLYIGLQYNVQAAKWDCLAILNKL